MKKLWLGIILVVFCVIVSNFVIIQPVKANDVVLTLTYGDERKQYNLDDLLAFDSITGNGSRINKVNKITGPFEYTGVLITTFAQEFTDIPSQYYVSAIGSDGYIVNYTYDEIQGEVNLYDTTGKVIGVGGVSVVLATKENGQTGYNGSLRIVCINQEQEPPITFSALWAKYVIELKFIPPPIKPDTPSGPPSGKIGEQYSYSTKTADVYEDQMYYFWDWGDGSDSGWRGPYDSGTICEANHIWVEKNNYSIKVKAKNVYGVESVWSDPLPITMPYSYQPIMFFQWLLERFPHAFPLLRQLMG